MFINNVDLPELANEKRSMEIDGSNSVMLTMPGHWLTCDTVAEQHSKSFASELEVYL